MRSRPPLDNPGYRPPWRLILRPLIFAVVAIIVWLLTTWNLSAQFESIKH